MAHPKKYSSQPLMTAADLLNRQIPTHQRAPASETVLIIMQRNALEFSQRKIWGKRSNKAPAKVLLPHKWANGPSLLGDIGVGGTSVVAHLEYLAAWGVKQVVLIGVAGGLLPSISYGDVVVPTRSLRDEGVSIHYLPESRWARPAETLNLKITQALADIKPKVHSAPVWTTAAPFRETQAEVQDYAAEGMAAVEMETASLFAAAQSLGIAAAAVLVISDSLAAGVHQMTPNQQIINRNLQLVCDRLIQEFKH
ncbi:MAG: nucleoside phosphorylase [Anaerolineae bacterium]